ncbi:hypothetical protein ACHAXR_008094, partial [Thalassiosira sp. AJA248-18]
DTAVSCVQQVFPSSNITPKCVNKYPIRVIIEAHGFDGGGSSKILWEGDQKSLFRKYASRRKKAQEDMVNKLNAFKAASRL